jgi:hypothetical protein
MSMPEYGPPGYPPPPPPPSDWQAPRPTSGKAIASLICAAAGLLVCFVVSIVGLILGIIGITETGKNGTRTGRVLAIAGTVLSVVTLAINLAVLILFFSFGAMAEQQQEEHFAKSLDEDVQLIVARVREYYRSNDNSLGPGGPVLARRSDDALEATNGRNAPARVIGVLTIRQLVGDRELKWSVERWDLTVTDRAKATVVARDWSGGVLREIHITDAGTGAFVESTGSTIR